MLIQRNRRRLIASPLLVNMPEERDHNKHVINLFSNCSEVAYWRARTWRSRRPSARGK